VCPWRVSLAAIAVIMVWAESAVAAVPLIVTIPVVVMARARLAGAASATGTMLGPLVARGVYVDDVWRRTRMPIMVVSLVSVATMLTALSVIHTLLAVMFVQTVVRATAIVRKSCTVNFAAILVLHNDRR